MARIYFDPDKDELVSTRKLTPKERAALKRMLDEDADEFDDDSENLEDTYADPEIRRTRAESTRRRAANDDEYLQKLENLEDAIRENTEAVQMNGIMAQQRHEQNRDTVATIAGGVIGYKLASSIFDDIVDTLNPFSSECSCKKKKWF